MAGPIAPDRRLVAEGRTRHHHGRRAQRRIQRKQGVSGQSRLASLEAIETLMVRCSMMGFGLLTLGLVMGLVIHVSTGNGSRVGGIWSR